jgi:hypothetical protein
MLDYLISLLDFTIGDTSYNLITTPWDKMLAWIYEYEQHNNNQYSTAVRDAYESLGKLGVLQACLVIVLIILATWLFYKIAHGFTGWMRFR